MMNRNPVPNVTRPINPTTKDTRKPDRVSEPTMKATNAANGKKAIHAMPAVH